MKEQMEKRTYNEMLFELMGLRETNYDKFMEKLYEALTGEFNVILTDNTPISEKISALKLLLQYFQDKEQYEKCIDLKKILESLEQRIPKLTLVK